MKKIVKKGKGAPQKPLTKAQQELVAIHIPFAMNMGRKYEGLGRSKGIPVEDLQQEACYGLCIAAQNFDSSKGADFQTYAHNWCKKFIMKAIKGEPLSSFEDKDVEDDIIYDDEQAFAEEREQKVKAMLTALNAQEKKVVCMIFGIGTSVGTIKEIAQKMHLQTSRVHQIYEKSMAKMEFQNS